MNELLCRITMIKNKAEHLGKNPQTPQISPWETEPESRVAKPRGPGSKVSGSSCAAENAPLTSSQTPPTPLLTYLLLAIPSSGFSLLLPASSEPSLSPSCEHPPASDFQPPHLLLYPLSCNVLSAALSQKRW